MHNLTISNLMDLINFEGKKNIKHEKAEKIPKWELWTKLYFGS